MHSLETIKKLNEAEEKRLTQPTTDYWRGFEAGKKEAQKKATEVLWDLTTLTTRQWAESDKELKGEQ